MPMEHESKKNIKGNKRAASSLDQEQGHMINQANGVHGHHNSHLLGNSAGGGVQVSQGGTLLIGPGGRPKTSSGKNTAVTQSSS